MQFRSLVGAVAAAAATTLVLAVPAFADVTAGCSGEATIDGVPYTPANDTPSNPIVVPKDEGVVIPWKGGTTFDNNGHHGSLNLIVGPFSIEVDDWDDTNGPEPNQQSNEDVYSLDKFYDDSPFGRNIVGIYELTGTHTADGGSCSGNAMVKFEGNVLASPIGAGSVVLIVITAGGIAMATFARKVT